MPSTRSTQRLDRTFDIRTRTAYHEAGHAVLSAAINDRARHVSIRVDHGTLGRTGQLMTARATSLAQIYLAGFAAEHLLTKRRSRNYDIETGLAILAHTDPTLMSTFEGVEASDGYGAIPTSSVSYRGRESRGAASSLSRWVRGGRVDEVAEPTS